MAGIGVDLLVVAGMVAHDGAPLDLARQPTAARGNVAPGLREAFDLAVASGRENLAQALILRLMTPRGSLASLGHDGYGSRVHELIGMPKTEALRSLCRAFVLEVVAQEPRVADDAVELVFDHDAETPSSLAFTLAVRPTDGGDPLRLSLEVTV